MVVLTLAACWVRASGLPTVQGTMGRDEARLALAARGILEHGLPILPGGFLYTRGLLPAALEAVSFAVLGVSDQAARLPSVVFGTLLVPAVYQVGRLVGGHWPALAAATIVAFSPPLVLQGREAWLYSGYLFWLVSAFGWLLRDGPGDRLRAGLAAVAALLCHELAVLLVPVAALLDLGRAWTAHRAGRRSGRRDVHDGVPARVTMEAAAPRPRGPAGGSWRQLALFWALLLAGVASIAGLSLALRSPTLGGATVELREYLRPGLDLRGLELTLGILGGWHPWLLPAAALALPLSWAALRRLLADRGVGPLLLMVLAVLLFNAFALVRRGEGRYVLAAIPFLALLAAVAVDRSGPALASALVGRVRSGRTRQAVRAALLLLLVAASLDPARLVRDGRERAVSSTWLQALADRAPEDPVVSFAPTLTDHYLGRTDVWLRVQGYAKYVWDAPSPLRDVHTGALVVRTPQELERLLLVPQRGRTIWVVLEGEPAAEGSRGTRELAQQLAERAAEIRRPADGRVVLKVPL